MHLKVVFEGCSGFTGDLAIPESVTTIGMDAFSDCSGFTGNLTIPKGVTSIGSRAFRNCTLTNIYCKPIIPPALGDDLGCNTSSCTLYVPTNCTEAYSSDPMWSRMTFKEIIETEF